jgi:hypothetical protein
VQTRAQGTAKEKKNNDVSEEERQRQRDRDAMQRWEHHGNIVVAGMMIMGTSWGWEGFVFVREVGCKWDVVCKTSIQNYGNSNISQCKFFKTNQPFKRNQKNPSRYYYNSIIITNLKFQTQAKISSFQNPPIKIDLLLPKGQNPLKLLYSYYEPKKTQYPLPSW